MAHPKSFACHADVDVVAAGISMRRDRTWRKPHTTFCSHASHAAARLRGSDGDAERRQKEVASSWISTGWQRLRQMRPRQERQLAKERREARKRLQCAAREGVWSAVGCRGPECDFAYFLNSRPRVLGANGHGAPPQAHIHLNLEVDYSGSPRTKFGPICNGCNRRFQP